MPDIHALLWPRTVALIGASADAESLRGRIINIMPGHAFQGQLYPVTRSSNEVMGLKAYASIQTCPRRHSWPSSSSPPSMCRRSWSDAEAPA